VNAALPSISIWNLLVAFIPVLLLVAVMKRWGLVAHEALYASGRMLVQLLLVGYVLTFVFETDQPMVVAAVFVIMICVAAWIAIRPIPRRGPQIYLIVVVALGVNGLGMLALVTQVVLDLPRWFEPRFVVPLAGMIFANTMNTVSLAAERFESERQHQEDLDAARRTALQAALIPQINALLAVGLVSLPGMMTGQILSGVDPMVAVRYQIMVMCMVFGSGGLGAATYLALLPRILSAAENDMDDSHG
jgi:putative ABC transport system permease protein